MSDPEPPKVPDEPRRSAVDRFLGTVERVGNKLPDPAVLFLLLLVVTWIVSWLLSRMTFDVVEPSTGEALQVVNLLEPTRLVDFLSRMVTIFTSFHPLGVVLVALLGVGVAEHTGFINAALKYLLGFTPKNMLTPMLIFVAILSHTAADAGYVLVIPLGGIIFMAAGRHPLAGIAAAFAGVSGGFSANPIISSIDPLLQGLTQEGAQVLDPTRTVNPLCNWLFTGLSSIPIILVGWYLTDRVIEPRLRDVPVDGDPEDMPKMDPLTAQERKGFWVALGSVLLGVLALVAVSLPEGSILRYGDSLTHKDAPLMKMIVPLIFIFFVIPGIVYGYAAKTVKSHRDIIEGMSRAMSSMGYYLVMAFFASLFITAFGESKVGILLALQGAEALQQANVGVGVTIVGIIFLTGAVNLVVGSASAKWALLSPIFVPMLMALGIAPEFTQAAYRVGDSTTNIITPLMPYFPLVVVFCQRYVRGSGIGTLTSMMLPYSVCYLLVWTVFLLIYWQLGIPLGVDGAYEYSPPTGG